MNLLVFAEHELDADRLFLTDRRADHIRKILGLAVGDTLRLGMINGKIGLGEIVSIDETVIDVRVRLDSSPAPTPDITLILALPRPIMLQRILKQATVLGVRRFHLIRSAKVEKSFFHSPALKPEKIHARLLESLEQAMDTHLPEVIIHHRFKPFVEDVVPTLDGSGIIAHPGISAILPDILPDKLNKQKILLAVGPEGGWNDFELGCFEGQGFRAFSMGNRILHVDTAVVALLAQLQLLFDMRAV